MCVCVCVRARVCMCAYVSACKSKDVCCVHVCLAYVSCHTPLTITVTLFSCLT